MRTNLKEDIFLDSGKKCNFEFTYGQTRPGSHRSIFLQKSLNHMFLGLLDPDPDPLVRYMDPDPDPEPDPSIIKQN
jgi:hypothetical protein